jgi:hypothetical protein
MFKHNKRKPFFYVCIYCRKSGRLLYCTTFNLRHNCHPSIMLCWNWNRERLDTPSPMLFSFHSECRRCFRNNCSCLRTVETIWNCIFIAVVDWSISVRNMPMHSFHLSNITLKFYTQIWSCYSDEWFCYFLQIVFYIQDECSTFLQTFCMHMLNYRMSRPRWLPSWKFGVVMRCCRRLHLLRWCSVKLGTHIVMPPYPRVIFAETYHGYVKPRIIPNAVCNMILV